MSEEHKTPEKVVVGNVYQLVTGLTDSQQLTISGNLAYGASVAEMGEVFDKLLAVTNRLTAKHRIVAKKADIVQGETILNAAKADLAQLDATHQEQGRLTTIEKNNREGMVSNIRRIEGKLEADRNALAELQKEAE